jgi:arylesterase / paraoxonase
MPHLKNELCSEYITLRDGVLICILSILNNEPSATFKEAVMKKKIIIAICIVTGVLAIVILKTYRDAGEFAILAPHSNCSCVRVNNVPGPEDIVIDHSTGTAFVSSFNRRALMKGKFLQGTVFAYNLEGKPVLKALTGNVPMEFSPHGLSFYKAPDGRKYLFVINHQKTKNVIEIFEYRNNMLKHLETISGDLMISPNDVAAAGPRQFYFTNDHGSKSAFGKRLEDYLQLSRSNVAYYDGKQIRIVADGFTYANGIWVADEGKHLYLATTTGKKFYVYDRSADGSLKLVSELSLGTGGDNIDIGSDGVIRVAAHPKLLTFVKHAKDRKNKAPSQILEIVKDAKGGYAYREIYLNLGDEISAASVAAVYKKRLLLGTVFDDFFLDCTMK